MTRKLHKLIPAVTLALVAADASAQMVYEPFNYNTGALGANVNPTTGGAWLPGTTGTEHQVVAGSLTPPTGLSQPTLGNMVQWNDVGNNRVERINLGTIQS